MIGIDTDDLDMAEIHADLAAAVYSQMSDPWGAIETRLELAVSPEDDAEVRRLFVEMVREDLPLLGLRLPDLTRGVRQSYARSEPMLEAA